LGVQSARRADNLQMICRATIEAYKIAEMFGCQLRFVAGQPHSTIVNITGSVNGTWLLYED